MDNGSVINGPHQREKFGIIVTFENADGDRMSVHRPGPPETVLRQIVTDVLEFDPTFLILSISTPQSIYTDIAGKLRSLTYRGNPPERRLVAVAGLPRELLHKSLRNPGRLGR